MPHWLTIHLVKYIDSPLRSSAASQLLCGWAALFPLPQSKNWFRQTEHLTLIIWALYEGEAGCFPHCLAARPGPLTRPRGQDCGCHEITSIWNNCTEMALGHKCPGLLRHFIVQPRNFNLPPLRLRLVKNYKIKIKKFYLIFYVYFLGWMTSWL